MSRVAQQSKNRSSERGCTVTAFRHDRLVKAPHYNRENRYELLRSADGMNARESHSGRPEIHSLWPAAMILWGPGFSSTNHRHHSVQLLMALDGNLLIRSGPVEQWRRCAAALVRPDAAHEVDALESRILIAFVDPQSDLGGALIDKVASPICPVDEGQVRTWRDALGDPRALASARVESWMRTHLLAGQRVPSIHPKVRRALRVLREELVTQHRFPLSLMAEVAGLSPSRFMHIFTESVGVPVRRYILWLRVQRACGELMRGGSVTEAAHRSGFSDSAHLTRTLRRMMGITPGDLVRRRPYTNVTFCWTEPALHAVGAGVRDQSQLSVCSSQQFPPPL
jgi:AraC-like DNA-binding protein